MKTKTVAPMIIIALLTMLLTLLATVLIRSASLPACAAKVGEICVIKHKGGGPVLTEIKRSTQIEAERHTLSFRTASGEAYDLTVVRDDSLGAIEVSSRDGASTRRIETRLWNGARSSSYVVRGSVPGISVEICVESWLWPRCGKSGTLTRLTPYRG